MIFSSAATPATLPCKSAPCYGVLPYAGRWPVGSTAGFDLKSDEAIVLILERIKKNEDEDENDEENSYPHAFVITPLEARSYLIPSAWWREGTREPWLQEY